MKKEVMSGCTAATYIAYAMSDVATIYPITPIAEMGEIADKWSIQGRKNLMGNRMLVEEMESELGAAGATHGALCGGALATTFTSSQGLMLMIPNMYRMAGEMLPAVFHIGTRVVGTHALSIFGDHSDVMECRATGFSLLASCSVQETLDMAIAAHLAAIESSLPVLHFFDGWRTANEMQSIEVPDYEQLRPLVNWDKVAAFRARAMNPEKPQLRGTAQNPDIYFQNREARNKYYDALPGIFRDSFRKVKELTGRSYDLFEYYGDPEAEAVTVSMASSTEVIRRTIDYLNSHGYKCGHVNVRVFRPFVGQAFADAIPPTARVVCTLDRTRENGAQGEPLFMDACTALMQAGRQVPVIRGRYGIGSKEFKPAMVKAVYDNMLLAQPKREFTVGIVDDVTKLSIPWDENFCLAEPQGSFQAIFYGMGSDGTVGATKQTAKILSDRTPLYTQAYFHYSAKKSGGYTINQLRIEPTPVRADYGIERADYIGCHKDKYVSRFELLAHMKPGGIFVLNSQWTLADMEREFPASLKRAIAQKRVQLYNVDATGLAEKYGLGTRINTIMQTVFFHLLGVIPEQQALEYLKESIRETYIHEGENIVSQNILCIEAALTAVKRIDYPQAWATVPDNGVTFPEGPFPKPVPQWIKEVDWPMLRLQGDKLPVSKMSPDGVVPVGTTAFERRCIANNIPAWDPEKCVECAQCSLVCSHASIRPFVASEEELAGAPETFAVKDAWAPELKPMKWRIQVYPQQCTGCGSCATVCPGNALTMTPIASELETQKANLQFAQTHISPKPGKLPRTGIRGSQLYTPLFEFSGACGGCGETPYIKLVTQLFGEHIVIANATGCSSVYGGDSPSHPYCANENGHGPAWGNSLFEDNAEYAYGIAVALQSRRRSLEEAVKQYAADPKGDPKLTALLNDWLAVKDDYDQSYAKSLPVKEYLASMAENPFAGHDPSCWGRKAVWAFGGDGWAYDIGFAGLDHVMASGLNINVLVLDTQCYSNTGGQTSKATPFGACMKYDFAGKRTFRKRLAEMMLTYGNVFVAHVALGADMQQTIDALSQAEAYEGPSIVIAYCPCINWGIKSGMSHTILEERDAVLNGFWPIFTYNPEKGLDPLVLDKLVIEVPAQPEQPATPTSEAKPTDFVVHDPYGHNVPPITPLGTPAVASGAKSTAPSPDAPVQLPGHAIERMPQFSGTPYPMKPTPAFPVAAPPFRLLDTAPMLLNENRYAVLAPRAGDKMAALMFSMIAKAVSGD